MIESPHICTIIAKNYLAVARTLCQSFLEQHPNGKCFVLIIDDLEGLIDPATERFEIIAPAELGITRLNSFCFKYRVIELATAFKPFLMEFLIQKYKLNALLYLDPDIQVFNSLDGLYQSLTQYDMVVTPHLDKDYDDDLFPDTGNILRHGTYNLGFAGVSGRSGGLTFLAWWRGKLYNHCIASDDGSYFVDQKFIELLPSLFSNYYIEHGVGYNAAYWNLHSRYINQDGGTWCCNNELLYFYHFSHYNPNTPAQMVKPGFTNRYTMADRPDVAPLFAQYRKRVLENGYEQSHQWRYSLGFFRSGEPIPDALRIRYRNEPALWQHIADPFASSELTQEAVRMKHEAGRRALRERLRLRTRLRTALRKFK